MTVMPRRKAPALDLPLAGGGRFDLHSHKADRFTLLMFYRGIFCRRCRGNLRELDDKMDRLDALGTGGVVISMDDRDKAEQTRKDWGLNRVAVAYGMSVETARAWDLFLSTGIRADEAPLFSEPACFLIRADGTVQFAVINSMQRMRPYADDIIDTIARMVETGEPARGEV
ncbi:MAG: redoxin domain-containing protein [Alphaproteobacteria bacterium]|nr:redoxin domain-containing protein [Alphaproteobacteria bacterium]